jgi:hypothetical protein
VPLDLEARVRAAIAPPASRRAPWVGLLRSPWRQAAAAVFVIAAVIAGFGAFRPLDADVANSLERAALRLDETGPIVIEGTVLCRDCELEHRYGVEAPCRRIGHHGALATADGRIWNLVEEQAGADLVHNQGLLGRRVVVHGRMYRGARTLVVERFELQS